MQTQTYDIGTLDRTSLLLLAQIGARYLASAPLGAKTPLVVDSPKMAYKVFQDMAVLEQEEVRAALLDVRHRVLQVVTVAVGSLNAASVRLADVFREAVRVNAAALVAAHNHPSGDPTPSEQDVAITRKMVEAGKLLGVEVLDHLVIGRDEWISLKERDWGVSPGGRVW